MNKKELTLSILFLLITLVTFSQSDSLYGEKKEYSYYKNGKLRTSTSYLQNKLHGQYKEYDKNGDILCLIEYVQGEIVSDTIFLNYSPKKNRTVIPIKNGVIHGTVTMFDKKGEVIKKSNYKNGVLDGKTRVFQKGKLISEASFKDGRIYGEYKFFDKDITVTEYAQNGQLIRDRVYTDKKGVIKSKDKLDKTEQAYYASVEINDKGTEINLVKFRALLSSKYSAFSGIDVPEIFYDN